MVLVLMLRVRSAPRLFRLKIPRNFRSDEYKYWINAPVNQSRVEPTDDTFVLFTKVATELGSNGVN